MPDRRQLIVDEPPGYALHRWTGEALVSHFAQASEWPVLARFDTSLAPMVRAMLSERPDG
jgi:hypothetical protein